MYSITVNMGALGSGARIPIVGIIGLTCCFVCSEVGSASAGAAGRVAGALRRAEVGRWVSGRSMVGSPG
ncbi:hypothetical protein ABZ783_09205 [Micromonospora sp. NPDC047738]|uniref:hypothetical protein n=1 Tax=Micromonospora sp. NPDC047738 TaxID=3155741 RepID=UPI003405B7B9